MGFWRAAALGLAVWAAPVAAQDIGGELNLGQVQSAVLTIDFERVFVESAYGRRVAADLGAQSEQLAAENRRIEADLVAEEQSLTARRPTMTPEAFRAEAEAFDAKVQGIRAAQDAKEISLQTALDDARAAFLRAATPLLGQIMQESGAAVILDGRAVFLSTGAVDVTDRAIATIDAAIGDGTTPAP
jgi:Skp family chaperone for outer membrane proteins